VFEVYHSAFGSRYPDWLNALYAGGSARRVSYDVDAKEWRESGRQ
jgi:hypothetical protein